jgi:hypothetical protein
MRKLCVLLFCGSLWAQTSITVGKLNGTVFADQFPGADPCIQITNAQAVLPTTGGIVNATGFQGVLPVCSGTFSVGSGTKPVVLFLGASQITVQNTVTIFNQSSIIGIGENGSQGASIILAGSSFPASTPVIKFDAVQITLNARLIGVAIYCNTVAGCIGIDMGRAEDSTEVNHVMVYKYMGNCINFSNSASQLVSIYNLQCYADVTATNTTAINMVMANNSDAVKLSRISIVPLGASQQIAGINCNSCNMIADEVHIELSVDGIVIQGASGSATLSEINCLTTDTTCVHINSTTGFGVSAFGIRTFGAINSLKNDIGFFALTCTDESLPYYIFSAISNTAVSACNSANNGQIFTGEEYVAQRMNFTERGAVNGIAGADVCAGNTAAHALQCSYNNGTFFSIPQLIAAGTSTMAAGSIGGETCAVAVTTAAGGTATTDSIEWAYATAPTLTTDALLHISPYVTAGNVNFTRCNPTAGAITGTAIVINWRVIR